MFKVGDEVVYTDIQDSCVLVYEGEDNNPFKLHWLSYPDGTTGYIFSLDKIRHATSEEIAAGHRIDKSPLMQHLDKCEEVVKTWPKWKLQSVRDALGIPNLETLRDCDTSPNCKKFDEQVK